LAATGHCRGVPGAHAGDHRIGARKIVVIGSDDDGNTVDKVTELVGKLAIEEQHRQWGGHSRSVASRSTVVR